MYARILWMNDLSRRSDACVDPVRSLALLGDASVVLAHATGSRIQGRKRTREPSAEDHEILPAIREHATRHLSDLEGRLSRDGVPCDVRILPGKAEKVALRLVEDLRPDLVVAGTTGVSGLDRLLLGSNAIRFLRTISVPVLVIGSRAFRSVDALLCPVDLDNAEQEIGIHHAARLARKADGTVTFLSVVEPGRSPDDVYRTEEHLRAGVERTLGEPLPRHWRARAVVDSSPVDGILHAAKTHDIVVLPDQGKTGLQRLLTGSVAETIVKSCTVSVLVAR